MGLTNDLNAEIVKILKETWTNRDGTKVPETDDLTLANSGVALDATVLYADLAESTDLVVTSTPEFAAEVYKCYLNCACRIIRHTGGEITAFDGDRVMAVFLGEQKNTSAARAALAIAHAVKEIINVRLREQYPKLAPEFAVKQAVGIDTSKLLVARTGIRGANDLVWVGRAANIAAKLCSLRDGIYSTWITKDVYDMLHESVKVTDGKHMWEQCTWNARGMTVYRSKWNWPL